MFDKYYAHISAYTPDPALAKANSEIAKSIREASKEEVESRNRVDITLKEYEEMKRSIENLRASNDRMYRLFEMIGIPYEYIEQADLSSVETETCEKIDHRTLMRKTRVRIEFDVFITLDRR